MWAHGDTKDHISSLALSQSLFFANKAPSAICTGCLRMKVRLPHLPLFVDEIERLNHFIDVLNALDRHFARPQGARVYAAWRSTINDRDTSYLLGRNVFVHAPACRRDSIGSSCRLMPIT